MTDRRPPRRVLEGVLGIPATEGNQITVLRNGDHIFPAMIDAVRHSEHTVDFLTFIYWSGEIGQQLADAFCEAAARGVRVRILVDAVGARLMNQDLLDQLDASDCIMHKFRPVARLRPWEVNHRTHRKVMIVDEEIGFTGGVGIADQWMGDARGPDEWRDTHFELRGPAVDGLRAAFLDNWLETELQLFDPKVDRFPEQPEAGDSVVQVVRGTSETGVSDIAILFGTLMDLAQRRIRITTAYFVPDDDTVDALCAAKKRGIEVQILLPGPHTDKRFVQIAGESQYDRLVECGVEIWAYQPTMLHAKIITVDGEIASVGSANLNRRSTRYDDEVNLVVFDESVVAQLDSHFDEDLERSTQVTEWSWERRSPAQRFVESASVMFRPMS
ncbi:MAG: phospholipase D-like domain-containing protein [Acidimicrobiales bacterium]